MAKLDWLIDRPIAHRGLHDISRGIVENTPSAVQAAIDHGYGIEVDLQLSADGDAVVFHDETLGRLTGDERPVAGMSLCELRSVHYTDTADAIQSLPELLKQVAGKVPLVLELKSLWRGDTLLAQSTAEALRSYDGPVAVMSFDPALVVAMKRHGPGIVRGMVSCRFDDAAEWPQLSGLKRAMLRFFLHASYTRPDFVSYDLRGLKWVLPRGLRAIGIPVITWTVRSPEDAALAAQWADQITFEGFLPER